VDLTLQLLSLHQRTDIQWRYACFRATSSAHPALHAHEYFALVLGGHGFSSCVLSGLLIIAPLPGAQDVCSILNKGYHIRKHISERQQQNSTLGIASVIAGGFSAAISFLLPWDT
jgi:hypothetical protein